MKTLTVEEIQTVRGQASNSAVQVVLEMVKSEAKDAKYLYLYGSFQNTEELWTARGGFRALDTLCSRLASVVKAGTLETTPADDTAGIP